MKCGCYLVYQERRRKGSGEPYQKITNRVIPWAVVLGTQTIPEGAVVCGGDIIATVDAVDEPDWGCTYAKLDIQYKCNKCGETVFVELPDTEEAIGELLTKVIADLPDSYRDEALARKKQQEEEHRRRTDEFLAEFDRRRKGK